MTVWAPGLVQGGPWVLAELEGQMPEAKAKPPPPPHGSKRRSLRDAVC